MADGEDAPQAITRWRVPPELFRFTTTDRAELYTAIVGVFAEASDRLVVGLCLDDVADALPGAGWPGTLEAEELSGVLGQLVAWGLLDVTQDHAHAYASAEEYERRNLLYALTRRGEAAVAGVTHAIAQLHASGALQTAVLEAIEDRLAELCALLDDPASSDRRLFSALMELEGHLEGLRSSTTSFNAELQRLLRDEAVDRDLLAEVKASTVAYLEGYLANLDLRAAQIREWVERVDEHGVSTLAQRALTGAELPAIGDDPAPRWLAQRAARWDGLRSWFAPVGGEPARVDDLRGIARRAIVSVLAVLDRLADARRRPVSTAADFRSLARRFEALASDDDAHRLWGAAFGLGSARHAHLPVDLDAEAVAASTPWSDGPRALVSPRLRTHGRVEHVARTARVRTTAAVRARRQREAAAERARVTAAWAALATDGEVALSHLDQLDGDVLDRVLELLGRALAAEPDRDGRRRARTGDGRMAVTVAPPASPGATAVLVAATGRLMAPDYRITIAPVGTDRASGTAYALPDRAAATGTDDR